MKKILALFLILALIGGMVYGGYYLLNNTDSVTQFLSDFLGGFFDQSDSSDEPDEPEEPEVEEVCTVTFECNGGSAIESKKVENGKTIEAPEAPTREGFVFVGWYTSGDYAEEFDFSKPITKSCSVYARFVDTTDTTDTDGDGLTDSVEVLYGTDINKVDTDGDGLSDYIESAFYYNPLDKDTDKDGILDGQEDYDNDGIDNKTEIEIGTNPALADTDSDGLNDKDEIDIYNTNPVLEDTDGDGVSDGKEIELGTDPLVAQESFDLNLSVDNEDTVTPSVEIELSGEQVESLRIEAVDNENFFPETMPGYMGQAYDFSVDGEFSSAVIRFEFDMALLAEGADPVIYYFNEETQVLEELETIIDGNVASATVTHFSKYILVDRKIYNESFVWTDVWDSTQSFTDVEIVFVIDDSGSMDWNDPSYERLAVARTLIDNLPANSKIGLVRFDGNWPKTEALTKTLTSDKEEVKNYLTRTYFYSPGGTDMYNGIQKAFPLYESEEFTTLKLMIVLSDGETDDTYLHSSVIATANASNIRIYTVGLGNSTYYFNSYLKPLATNTGASFYLASNAEQLADIYKNISEKIDIETDSDGDGIPDYYEDNMICFNGVKLALDKNNPDTDGDGILDGEEVQLTFEYNDDRTKVRVTGKLVLGNPIVKDSDGDGYIDSEDPHPFVWDISDRDLAIAAGISYTNLIIGTKIEGYSSIDLGSGASVSEMVGWTVLDTWHGGAGFYAVALKKDNNIVLAFRGSKDLFSYEGFIDIDWIDDWVFADVINVMTGISTQAPAAQAFTEKIINKYSGYNIYICGHSLGGNLALNASIKALKISPSCVKRVCTFNGLGMPAMKILTELFTWDFTTLFVYEGRFVDYEIEGDPVSGLEEKHDRKWFEIFDLVLTTGIGYRDVLPVMVAGDEHSMENFYLQLKPFGRPIN